MVDDAAVVAVGELLDKVFLGLIAVLGASLFMVRPRTRASLALAGFLLCYGIFLNLTRLDGSESDRSLLLSYAGNVLTLVSTACLVALCLSFPRPARLADRRAIARPFALAVLAGLVSGGIAAYYTLRDDVSYRGWDPDWLNAGVDFAFTLGFCIYAGTTMVAATRFAQLARAADTRAARAAAHAALAFGPIAMLVTVLSARYLAQAQGPAVVFEAALVALALGMVGSWVWASAAAGPTVSGSARNVVVGLVAFGVTTLLVERFYAPGYQVLLAVARFTCLAVLTYAILRQQLFDLDMRLKMTLSRSTMAAVFLAVFFVVAQLAQNFLSTKYGWALGGVSAGLLLFVITPIQRAAERLSDKALPTVRPGDPAYVLRKKREAYRNAYAAAWDDGRLTAKDVRLLAEFKDALGLPHAEYAAIERDWVAGAPKA